MKRRNFLRAGLLALSAALVAPMAHAQETTALDRFLDGLVTWRAELTQSMTDSRGRLREPRRGVLLVQRPGRFRWQIEPPEQVMVADGRNLWFHDLDLEQVTVRPVSSAMSATPAALLAGTVALRSAFVVSALGRRDGLEWVSAKPRQADGEFREARFAFSGLELRRLEIDDKLGQRAVLVFAGGARNTALDPAELRFTPPPGADLIGKPAP